MMPVIKKKVCLKNVIISNSKWGGIFSLNPKLTELKLVDCMFKYRRKEQN